MLWDRGTWEPLTDPHAGFRAGKLHFILKGNKLDGEWRLVRLQGAGNEAGKNWLLIKSADKHSSAEHDILTEKPLSVKTRRSLDRIATERSDVWDSDAKKTPKTVGAVKAAFPKTIKPQLAVLSDEAPQGDDWLHEIKFDGYRFLAFLKDGEVTLRTRNGHDWTTKFPSIANNLKPLKVDSAVLDGEIVVLNAQGHSDFQALQAMLKHKEQATPRYYVFDLPFCDGLDLRKVPLIHRKKRLEHLLRASNLDPQIAYSDHVVGNGESIVAKACGMALEGIISKAISSPYVSRRDPTWLKSKCGQRQEFVIVGFSDPQGSRAGFGSLLLGYHNKDNKLVYAGRVGTGFDRELLIDLYRKLKRLERKDWALDEPPPAQERRHAHWVRPSLVAEIRFTEWTRDGVLRHPAFVSLRSDKPASQIVREALIKTPSAKVKLKAKRIGTAAPVHLTHPDKALYPGQHITKRDLADYYQAVQHLMLPHIAGRPLSLVRCPSGIGSKCFFNRNWAPNLPPEIGKVDVSETKAPEMHMTIQGMEGLLALVQLNVLEIHPWNGRNEDVEHPDQLIFDLDPGPGVPWKRVIEGARRVRRMLTSIGLPAFLKTSGGKGLHITVPIHPSVGWESAKEFCQTLVHSLAQSTSMFVANMRKDLRQGKIYVDYHRNGRGATAVAPYSTRARDGATVSMPMSWEELGRISSAAHFTVNNALQYLKRRRSDPWGDFNRSRIDLTVLASRTSAG